MKKISFTKILTVVLVCAALIGAVVGINASAADEKSVEIVSNNVWYGDTLRLAYAVKCDADVEVTVYLDETCAVEWCKATEADDTVTINGVECKKFYSDKGVPVQKMNTYLYAKAVNLENNEEDVQRYSVLEYLYERLYVSENVSESQEKLYNAQLAYAKAAEKVLYEDKNVERPEYTNPVEGYNYVRVTNGTIDGTYSAGMYKNGSQPFANIKHSLVDAIEENIAYNVSVNNNSASAKTLEDMQEYEIEGNTFVDIVETSGEVETEPTTISVSIADYADNNGWTDAKQYKELKMNDDITVSAIGGSNTGKYYTSGTNWRIYQSENATITVEAAEGKTIISVKITYTISNTGILTLNGAHITSDTVVEVNGQSIEFGVGNTGTKTNGQVRITAIEVVYQ